MSNNSFGQSGFGIATVEDDERRATDEIQKITDSFIKRIDEVLAEKEKELMEV